MHPYRPFEGEYLGDSERGTSPGTEGACSSNTILGIVQFQAQASSAILRANPW